MDTALLRAVQKDLQLLTRRPLTLVDEPPVTTLCDGYGLTNMVACGPSAAPAAPPRYINCGTPD
ncbi:MAG TPA: hypothetical protein VEH31_08280 [Streptosporangiaceae bacterium]|nr:hypothetical protein [Streptosporangiaceae bacterium]